MVVLLFLIRNARINLSLLIGIFALLMVGISNGENLPDPTRPPTFGTTVSIEKNATANTLLELQSILIAPERRWAIINNQIVVIGDVIGAAQLIEIKSDAVTLARGDIREILKLFPNINRNP